MTDRRTRRVLIYAGALLVSPMPVMPFAIGTRESFVSLLVCAVLLGVPSYWVARGEWRRRPRSRLGQQLLICSLLTLGFSVLIFAVSFFKLLAG